MYKYKEIHVGNLIQERVEELEIPMSRIVNFLAIEEEDIIAAYEQESLDTVSLLKWSKLLDYDFFRIFTQHLIIYAPSSSPHSQKNGKPSNLPQFRKNIYTREIIEFILELIHSEAKTPQQIIKEYRIPKTTLYKWIMKYKKSI